MNAKKRLAFIYYIYFNYVINRNHLLKKTKRTLHYFMVLDKACVSFFSSVFTVSRR